MSNLRRPDREAPHVERLAQRHRDLAIAEPAHFHDRCFECSEREGRSQPRCRATDMEHEVGVTPCGTGLGELHPKRRGRRLAAWIDVDQLHRASCDPANQPRDEAADRPSADDSDAITNLRPRIPDAIDGRFEIRGEYRALRRNIVWKRMHGSAGDDVPRLMRIEHEYIAAMKLFGSAFDHADARITVFDRRWKIARLKGRAH